MVSLERKGMLYLPNTFPFWTVFWASRAICSKSTPPKWVGKHIPRPGTAGAPSPNVASGMSSRRRRHLRRNCIHERTLWGLYTDLAGSNDSETFSRMVLTFEPFCSGESAVGLIYFISASLHLLLCCCHSIVKCEQVITTLELVLQVLYFDSLVWSQYFA